MHFFGVWGTIMFLIGGGIAIWILGSKVYESLVLNHINRDVTEQPLFYLSLTLTIIGVQMFLAGFLGELISRSSSDRNAYLIEKEI